MDNNSSSEIYPFTRRRSNVAVCGAVYEDIGRVRVLDTGNVFGKIDHTAGSHSAAAGSAARSSAKEDLSRLSPDCPSVRSSGRPAVPQPALGFFAWNWLSYLARRSASRSFASEFDVYALAHTIRASHEHDLCASFVR